MRPTHFQRVLLACVTAFWALQVLPHHFTSFHRFMFPYQLVALLVGLVLALSTAVMLVMWLLATFDPEREMKRRQWLVTFILMLLAAVGLTLSSIAYAHGLPTGSFASRYHRDLWASSPMYVAGDITPRQKMLGDVIHNIVVNGNRDDIVAALGPSHDEGYLTESGGGLSYCTGPLRDSFPIDNEWLHIWLDENGRTQRYEIWSD